MKAPAFLTLMLLFAFLGGCSTVPDKTRQADIEPVRQQLIGAWEGEYVDSDGKLVRSWIQQRSDDGTYTIVFTHHTEKGAFQSRQTGTWWIEGDRFYEIASDGMKEPDAYQFDILNENEIRFKSLTKAYEFIDRRCLPPKGPTFI